MLQFCFHNTATGLWSGFSGFWRTHLRSAKMFGKRNVPIPPNIQPGIFSTGNDKISVVSSYLVESVAEAAGNILGAAKLLQEVEPEGFVFLLLVNVSDGA